MSTAPSRSNRSFLPGPPTLPGRRNLGALYAKHALLGAAIGVLLLHPIAMLGAWLDHGGAADISRVHASFSRGMLLMAAAYAAVGAAIGAFFARFGLRIQTRDALLTNLSAELSHDVASLIRAGETECVEFKSTLRWDLRKGNVNKSLEHAIAKSVAGIANHSGGSLVIGVDDDGGTVGLEHDYATLKRRDRDGFQQRLMGLVQQKLGADICTLLHVAFVELDGADVCRVVVARSETPVYLRDNNRALYYVRTGNVTRELDAQETVAHIARRRPQT